MIGIHYYSLRNSCAKWLFTGVLFLSFFTFSGVVGRVQTTTGRPEITLVVSSKTKQGKSIGYKRALIIPYSRHNALPDFIGISFFHSQQAKVYLAGLSSSFISIGTGLFYRPKTACQITGDEPVFS